MSCIDIIREVDVSDSPRARQLEGMFDVPRREKCVVEWHGEIDLEAKPWSLGLIVGPSGAGKSTLARELFGKHVDRPLKWKGKSVIDDFSNDYDMGAIAAVCQAVGFNTIPAWLRPFSVLSTGERFRVEIARRLLEHDSPVVVDEFTSVVDRQVAKIGCHAIQKYVRRSDKQFVGVSCHYDIVDWLQPDWVLDPTAMILTWRSVQPRPKLEVAIGRVPHAAWKLFAPFHYMTAELNQAATCYALFVGDRPACIAAVLHRPHRNTKNIKGISRLVTLPDWQGMGLAFVLMDALGGAYKTAGYLLHAYPAHPSLMRSLDRSACWTLRRRPATFVPSGSSSMYRKGGSSLTRPCATFRYIGPAMDKEIAAKLLNQAS